MTKEILNEYAKEEDKKFNSKDYKYARIQAILDEKAKIGWEKRELKKLSTLREKELNKTRSDKKQAVINQKYDLMVQKIHK